MCSTNNCDGMSMGDAWKTNFLGNGMGENEIDPVMLERNKASNDRLRITGRKLRRSRQLEEIN